MPRGGLLGGREAWAEARGERFRGGMSNARKRRKGEMRMCKTRSSQGRSVASSQLEAQREDPLSGRLGSQLERPLELLLVEIGVVWASSVTASSHV